MCGRTVAARGDSGRMGRAGGGRFFGLEVEEMSPRGQIAAAASVLGLVALSGVFLLAYAPGVWWVFTTYFWVAFPAFGLLSRGLAGSEAERRAVLAAVEGRERELLRALREHGELSPVRAAAETSLTVAEADEKLRELAGGGHVEVRVRGGGLFYALWEVPRERAGLDEPEPVRQSVEGKGAA